MTRWVYRYAATGGTFNAFHEGHQSLLRRTCSLAYKVHIFLAGDDYAAEIKTYKPFPYHERLAVIQQALANWGYANQVTISELTSLTQDCQFTCTEPGLDLIVSDQYYYPMYRQWLTKRAMNGLPSFDILCKPRLIVDGIELSSTRLAP